MWSAAVLGPKVAGMKRTVKVVLPHDDTAADGLVVTL